MKLLVGLGNPGEKYKNNRHNVGQIFIEYLIRSNTADIKTRKLRSSFVNYLTPRILLSRTSTFMNNSGIAVKELIRNFGLKAENLLVAHDDLDIPLGKFKIQKGKGPLLHNGIESIEKALAVKDFWRVRIGIDNRQDESGYKTVSGEKYVLSDFTPEEKKIILELFPELFSKIKMTFLQSL